ncbi:sugar ABC transporter substrate-binding protein [Rhodovulum viride]|uniref:Sugar ABC transporter substrate-binding protein n=1 Tax=Rhodovulum viride TaxID=1231134 RepID=A0ABX9DJW9_9RHOB|nr:sugar ABC transporter substrate-binding protein [Rhodovulum viride]
MKRLPARGVRLLVLFGLLAATAACGLPRPGPNKPEIFDGSTLRDGDAFIVEVNDRVNRATAVVPASGFPASFLNAAPIGSDTIRAGDTLGLTVFENVDDGLLAPRESNAATLNEVQVDSSGYIFIPYAGRIQAAGSTPEGLREKITEKLDAQTPDPQVMVTRLAGDGATVSVAGGVGKQGVFPIERPNRTLSGMLASAGGIVIPPEIAQITVIRGKTRGQIWFEDLYADPSLDIALRNGDRILVEEDTRDFTALGATGNQRNVRFITQSMSAVEALAQVGGLSSALADPTGIFVLRNEPEEIARQVLARDDLVGEQRVAYVLNLTEPAGLFLARDFAIRDGDTVYVTEAPYVRWIKLLSVITGTAGAARNVSATVEN